jgi:SAM-dependent methyltransferase
VSFERPSGPDSRPTPDDVRRFYDELTDSRMLAYLERPNQRIQRAIERVLGYVDAETVALEIGCGVGLVTDAVAHVAKDGGVWACDISENAVRHARERVRAQNVRFLVCDAVHEFERLRSWLRRPVQLVMMIDVIEHIPLEEHALLLRNLCTLLDAAGTIVLTYPAPDFQRRQRERDPATLQLVDEIVELKHVERLAAANGLAVEHYSIEQIWSEDYAHCVLTASGESRRHVGRSRRAGRPSARAARSS